MNLALISGTRVPALIATAGDQARMRFLEFFTANIRNPNTRRSYAKAAEEFLAWCSFAGVPSIADVQPIHVATYIEQLARENSVPTVKARLAAIRHLFDWLVVGQVVRVNPAASVRGPRHVVKKGKTPVLSPDEARRLLDSIDVSTDIGLRDRALIGLMVYSFARVTATRFTWPTASQCQASSSTLSLISQTCFARLWPLAAAYASMRMARELWTGFIDDLEAKRSISVSPKELWS